MADVGDLTGTGYEDFAIGAPGTGGAASAVYVVFGSATGTAPSTENWIGVNTSTGNFNYTANDRVGDLGQLGAASQTNPITTNPLDFPSPA